MIAGFRPRRAVFLCGVVVLRGPRAPAAASGGESTAGSGIGSVPGAKIESAPQGTLPAAPTASVSGAPGPAASGAGAPASGAGARSEEHTSELQSRGHLVCRLML